MVRLSDFCDDEDDDDEAEVHEETAPAAPATLEELMDLMIPNACRTLRLLFSRSLLTAISSAAVIQPSPAAAQLNSRRSVSCGRARGHHSPALTVAEAQVVSMT